MREMTKILLIILVVGSLCSVPVYAQDGLDDLGAFFADDIDTTPDTPSQPVAPTTFVRSDNQWTDDFADGVVGDAWVQISGDLMSGFQEIPINTAQIREVEGRLQLLPPDGGRVQVAVTPLKGELRVTITIPIGNQNIGMLRLMLLEYPLSTRPRGVEVLVMFSPRLIYELVNTSQRQAQSKSLHSNAIETIEVVFTIQGDDSFVTIREDGLLSAWDREPGPRIPNADAFRLILQASAHGMGVSPDEPLAEFEEITITGPLVPQVAEGQTSEALRVYLEELQREIERRNEGKFWFTEAAYKANQGIVAIRNQNLQEAQRLYREAAVLDPRYIPMRDYVAGLPGNMNEQFKPPLPQDDPNFPLSERWRIINQIFPPVANPEVGESVPTKYTNAMFFGRNPPAKVEESAAVTQMKRERQGQQHGQFPGQPMHPGGIGGHPGQPFAPPVGMIEEMSRY